MKGFAVDRVGEETSPTLKELGKIIFYLLATVVIGALLAAPLYWGGQWLAAHGILTFLGEVEFRRFFHRALLVAAIALLWPTVKWLQVPNLRALGLQSNPQRWRDGLVGFLAAFIPMALLVVTLVQMGFCKWKSHVEWDAIGKIALSAMVVPLLEESLFRGGILGLLNRALSWRSALFFSSALFSIIHFLKPDNQTFPGPVRWYSAFELIPGAFAQFAQPWLVLSGFTTLLLVGSILGWTRLRTHSLALPIGLHAGWVFGMMGFGRVTKRIMKNTLPWFGDSLLIGLGAIIVVLITGLVVWLWITYVARPQPEARR
jgi:membrane protease YdiL (CAAX protease family)